MNFVSKITNNQSSIICLRSSVFSLLTSVSFFGFLSSAVCPLSSVFMQNKPNSPIVQLNASIFITMNYAIFTSLTKVKNKPNQTQFKPKANPIQTQTKLVLSAVEWANCTYGEFGVLKYRIFYGILTKLLISEMKKSTYFISPVRRRLL